MKDYRHSIPAKFTGEMYGKKVSIELPNSDLTIDDVFDTFKGLALGLGFTEELWNDWVKETAYDIESNERINEWNEEESGIEYEDFPNGEGYDDWQAKEWNNNTDEDKVEFDWDKDVDTDYMANEKPDEDNTELGGSE